MSKRKGFTLIELLVVIAIIGILSAVVIASMSGARSKGRDAKRIADTKQLQLALQLFYDGNSRYPCTGGNVNGNNTIGCAGVVLDSLKPSYLTVLPSEPISGRSYVYVPLPSGCDNGGVNPQCTDYVLAVQLENVPNGLDGYIDATPTFSINSLTNANCSQSASNYIYCVKP